MKFMEEGEGGRGGHCWLGFGRVEAFACLNEVPFDSFGAVRQYLYILV